MVYGEVQEFPPCLFPSKHIVYLSRSRLSLRQLPTLICLFKILNWFIWISSVEALDFCELFVEFIEWIAR